MFRNEGIPLDEGFFGFNTGLLFLDAFTDPMNSAFRQGFFVFLERVPPVITAVADSTPYFHLVVDASRHDDF